MAFSSRVVVLLLHLSAHRLSRGENLSQEEDVIVSTTPSDNDAAGYDASNSPDADWSDVVTLYTVHRSICSFLPPEHALCEQKSQTWNDAYAPIPAGLQSVFGKLWGLT